MWGPRALSLCKVQSALLRPKVAYHLNLNVLPLSPHSFPGILSLEILKHLSYKGQEFS